MRETICELPQLSLVVFKRPASLPTGSVAACGIFRWAVEPGDYDPLLTGKDLIKLGLKPGPAIGKLLAELREKQLADELKTKPAARAWVKTRLADRS